MRKQSWDEALRRRAREEGTRLTPEAEARFAEAMARGRRVETRQEAPKRRSWSWALAAGCALALLMLMWPVRDRVNGWPAPREADIVPITHNRALAPVVRLDATLLEGARVSGSFANDTEEIWLIEWTGQADETEAQTHLLWLEPGASCEDGMDAPEGTQTLRWSYRGYRVTAKMLHWLDAGDADERQEMMEAAFEAEALILSPGDWENGEAGEMALPLPDSYLAAHPETDALAYYQEKGILTAAFDLCQGENSVTLPEAEP